MSVNMSGSWAVGLGVGVGSYQPVVYVPLKALFLVILICTRILVSWVCKDYILDIKNLPFLHKLTVEMSTSHKTPLQVSW